MRSYKRGMGSRNIMRGEANYGCRHHQNLDDILVEDHIYNL